ncbi:MAG: hypothetical protein HY812_19825 [Planctomycetes bacterium]|nr:hypothetical protein [Planctomycetota bacterium]
MKPSLLSFLNGDDLERAPGNALFAGLPGVSMKNGHEGTLAGGGLEAKLLVEQGDVVSLKAVAAHCLSPLAALRINRVLPGNLRFARSPDGLVLLADTHLDGSVHLAATFRETLLGLERARAPLRRPLREPGCVLEPGHVARLAAGLRDPALGEAPLPLEDGSFELRPRLAGAVVPLTLRLERSGVRVQRSVVRATNGKESALAVAMQALRLNAEVREARLAAQGGEVVAETRLHCGQIEAAWLVRAAQAVAAAWNHAQATLRILAQQDEVSALFRAMFCLEET